ncbi:MAG: prolyl oligopeptidase family serine peptidase [Thermogutta sp.]|nr:prolyl oligopeptidase family serine peptidase [Thermogutta sp.]
MIKERMEKRVFTNADGETLPYRLHLPEGYDPAKKYPLILFLHGAGERGDDNEAQLRNDEFLNLAAVPDHPVILVAPQCPRDQWWSAIRRTPNGLEAQLAEGGLAMKLTIQLLDAVQKEFSVDPARRYVTGLSMGGFGTFDLVLRRPKDFAAAVPICGGGDESRAAEMKETAFWVFHGGADPVVPPALSQRMVEALKKAGAEVRYTEYPGVGHNSWRWAYHEPELAAWLFSHARSQDP